MSSPGPYVDFTELPQTFDVASQGARTLDDVPPISTHKLAPDQCKGIEMEQNGFEQLHSVEELVGSGCILRRFSGSNRPEQTRGYVSSSVEGFGRHDASILRFAEVDVRGNIERFTVGRRDDASGCQGRARAVDPDALVFALKFNLARSERDSRVWGARLTLDSPINIL